MNVPINDFTAEQRLWYAKLTVAAIKADDGFAPQEMSHLILALHFLTNAEKEEIQLALHQKTPILHLDQIPSGLDKPTLAGIYTDLVRVVISDGKLTTKEHSFLNEVRRWFHFDLAIDAGLQDWTMSMLAQEQARRKLISEIK